VTLPKLFELFRVRQRHQPGQAFTRRAIQRYGVGLQIVFHLQPVLHLPEEAVSFVQRPGIARRKMFVSGEFLQTRQSLRILKERLPPGMQQLQRLHDEFNLPDPAAPKFHVPIQLPRFNNFGFDPVFHGGNFAKHRRVD
jgi:hypothetical protein